MENFMSAGLVPIPITRRVDFRHIPSTNYRILFAGQEFVKANGGNEGDLIYLEGYSSYGNLGLFDIPEGDQEQPTQKSVARATYDRDTQTREISKIFLKPEDVFRAAYPGNILTFLRQSNIRVLNPNQLNPQERALVERLK